MTTLNTLFAASGASLLLLVIIEVAFWVLVGSGAVKWFKGRGKKTGEEE